MAGARSLNEKNLHDDLAYFKIPPAGIEYDQMDTAPGGPSTPLITSVQAVPGSLIIFGAKRRRRRRTWASISTLYYIHFVTHIEGGDHKVASLKLSLSLSLSLSRTAESTTRINETV
jgi:hypothetical protein